ncbi:MULTISPECIES: hypothetical protein [Cupriavidus]
MVVSEEILTAQPMGGIASEVEAEGRANHLAAGRQAGAQVASPVARRASAVLKIMSALIKAVVIHPGSDSSDDQIVQATKDLMQEAKDLTDTMIEFAGLDPARKADAELLHSLSAQSAEIAALNWRLAHATGKRKIPISVLSDMIQGALDKVRRDEPEREARALDLVTAQRVALIAIVPDLHSLAVHTFDYFAPDPDTLVQAGVRAVLDMTEYGIERLNSDVPNDEARVTIARSLVPEMGALYISNYRYNAKKDVEALRAMDKVERMRRIHERRLTGLPTEHILDSFRRLARRMIDMIIEAVPALPGLGVADARVGLPGAGPDRSHL